MNKLLTNTEFFTCDNTVWYRHADGSVKTLLETDYDMVSELCEYISVFYPKAYAALCEEYKGSALNRTYYRYRIACRFIKCNFAALDNVPDIGPDLNCTFEYVNCPLRGECRYDRVICRPEFCHRLSAAEMQVMRLVFDGLTEEQIGLELKLSPHTIHTHIRNAYARLGVHSRAEFAKYALQNHLFS